MAVAIPLYILPSSMVPARNARSLIIGADFALGFRLLNDGVAIPLADWTLSATLKSAAGTSLATPTIDECDSTTARVFISHTITGTLTAQTATLRLWGTRVADGLVAQFLTSRITITK